MKWCFCIRFQTAVIYVLLLLLPTPGSSWTMTENGATLDCPNCSNDYREKYGQAGESWAYSREELGTSFGLAVRGNKVAVLSYLDADLVWKGEVQNVSLPLPSIYTSAVGIAENGDIYLGGSYENSFTLLRCTSDLKNIIWRRVYKGKVSSQGGVVCLKLDPEGGIYAAGYEKDGEATSRMVVRKIEPEEGKVIWKYSYRGKNDKATVGVALALDPQGDGVVVLAGAKRPPFADKPGWYERNDLLLVKLDGHGRVVWSVRYDKMLGKEVGFPGKRPGFSDDFENLMLAWRGQDVCFRADGCVMVAANETLFQGETMAALLEFGPDGKFHNWVNIYDYPKNWPSEIKGICPDGFGGIVAIGAVNKSRYLVSRITADGSVQWRVQYEMKTQWEGKYALVTDGNGGIIVAGPDFTEKGRTIVRRFEVGKPGILLGDVAQKPIIRDRRTVVGKGVPGAVAVVDFSGIGISMGEAKLLTEMFRGEMVSQSSYEIIDLVRMQTVLEEQKVQQSGCTEINCAVEIGKLLKANMVIVGKCTADSKGFHMEYRAVNEAGVVRASGKGAFPAIDGSSAYISKMVKELLLKIDSAK